MAHGKSAKKRIRQSEVKRLHNRSVKSALRTAVKKFAAAVKAGDAAVAASALRSVQGRLDKAAARDVVKTGTAARMKSRLSARLRALQAAKKPA